MSGVVVIRKVGTTDQFWNGWGEYKGEWTTLEKACVYPSAGDVTCRNRAEWLPGSIHGAGEIVLRYGCEPVETAKTVDQIKRKKVLEWEGPDFEVELKDDVAVIRQGEDSVVLDSVELRALITCLNEALAVMSGAK